MAENFDLRAFSSDPATADKVEQIKRAHFGGPRATKTARQNRHAKSHRGNGAERRHFNLVPFASVRVSVDPAYLIKGLIPRSGLTVVWGPPKCGKSFWMFDVAMHIALGLPY